MKLSLHSLGLHGRDKEISRLNTTFDQHLAGHVERQLILISGESGTGKSGLANTLKTPTKKYNGLFSRGLTAAVETNRFQVLPDACAEICDAILQLRTQGPSFAKMICNHIKTELGAELHLLFQVIPVLGKLCNVDRLRHSTNGTQATIDENQVSDQKKSGDTTASTSTMALSSADARNCFHFAFVRCLIRGLRPSRRCH